VQESPGAFSASRAQALADALVARGACRGNGLGPRFAATRGFAYQMRIEGLLDLARLLPPLSPDEACLAAPGANALFANALVVEDGGSVGLHVDASLSGAVGERVVPELVTVLYAAVPAQLRGGALVFRERGEKIAVVEPEAGKLVVFRGDLAHAVERVSVRGARGGLCGQEASRMSLVCESYTLPPAHLARIPRFAPFVYGAG
jgi:hypothetical protein